MQEQIVAGKRTGYLAPFMTLGALALCYGTIGFVALLAVFGTALEPDEGILAPIVMGLLLFIVASAFFAGRSHKNVDIFASYVLFAVLAYLAIFVWHLKLPEYVGFAGLVGTSIWDIIQKRRAPCAEQTSSCGSSK